ncbi:hypothetical protein [Streptomyces sp. NPDC001811]
MVDGDDDVVAVVGADENGVYANAGTPAAGSRPAVYPYARNVSPRLSRPVR